MLTICDAFTTQQEGTKIIPSYVLSLKNTSEKFPKILQKWWSSIFFFSHYKLHQRLEWEVSNHVSLTFDTGRMDIQVPTLLYNAAFLGFIWNSAYL